MTTSTILSDNGATSGSAGLKTTGGNDGTLVIQTTTSGGTATTAVTVDTSQNVGIGTSSPAQKLDVVGTTNRILWNVDSATFIESTLDAAGASYVNKVTRANQFIFQTGTTERMRIDSSGNVGIGTSSPAYPLDVYSSTGLITRQYSDTSVQSILANFSTNTSAAQLQFYKYRGTAASPTVVASGDITGRVQFYGYDGATLQPTAEIRSNVDNTPGAGDMPGRLAFYTTPDGSTTVTERMRIDSSGNLLVGTTSTTNSARLSVNGVVYMNNTIYAPGVYSLTTAAAANVHVASDGTLYRSTSSLKYKKDVQDAVHGLTEVMSLRPVTYKGKSEADGDTVFGGLIAEEVHAAGLTEFVQYAEDGSPDALAYGNMVSLCIKAIQEQQATIQALTARIEALEAK